MSKTDPEEVKLYKEDLIAAFQYLKEAFRELEENFLHGLVGIGQGIIGAKLKESRFRLDVGKKFFTMKVARQWNMLSREVVDASSMEVFKAPLDVV